MAGLLHISLAGYQRYERGERDIPAATVDRAREHLGVNPRWLLEGIGEMFLPVGAAPGPEAERIRRALGLDVPVQAPGLPGASGQLERLEAAAALVDRVMSLHDLPKQPTLREAMRALAAADGVTLDHISFLASAIAELLSKQG